MPINLSVIIYFVSVFKKVRENNFLMIREQSVNSTESQGTFLGYFNMFKVCVKL